MDEAETITLSKEQAEEFFRDWEDRYRRGECMSAEDSLARSVDDVAKSSAQMLFEFAKKPA